MAPHPVPPSPRRNLQSFLQTLARPGRRGSFARAGAVRLEELSCGDVLDRAGAIAGRLRGLGVAPGDRVLIAAEDGPAWIAGFAACLATGAVAVPLEASSSSTFIASVSGRCAPKAILAGERAAPSGQIPRVDPERPGEGSRASLAPIADPDPDDLAEIVFTSGTTAAPRGVMISHRNFLTALAGIEAGIERRRRAVSLAGPLTMISLVPLSHLFGQALGLLIPAILDARVVFSAQRPAGAILDLARRERAWVVILVPRQLAALRDRLVPIVPRPRGRLSRRWWIRALRSLPALRLHGWRLRAFVVGGARLDPEVEGWFKDLGYLVIQGYGLTETAPIVSVSNPFDARTGLIGRPGRAMEVRVAPDGEILIRGENVTSGYYGDEEATRAALEGGWLRTGDLGVLEPDGTLRLLGRKKEMIVTGEGQNVFPDEVEEALRRRPGVRDAVVFASGGTGGEQVAAAVISSAASGPGAEGSGEVEKAVGRAVAEANAALAAHQRIRTWSLWAHPDFPRTPTGKVIRRAVAAAVSGRGGEAAAAGSPEGGLAADPLALLRRLAGPGARADQKLGADLGLSSIDVAELTAAIEERYQVEVDPEKLHADTSLEALVGEAARSGPSPSPWRMPRWAISLPARAARSLLQALVVFPALRLFARLEVRPANRAAGAGGPRGSGAAGALPGAGQAGAGRGPVLIAANHSSHLDVLLLLASLPRRLRRRVAVAMQPEYFEPWLRGTGSLVTRLHMGWHYRLVSLLLNTFPFPRSAAFKVALEHAGRLVDRGWSVLVFPEGELSRDGGMQPFRPGVGVLARDLRLAVLPARIRGAFEILPRGGRFPRRWRSEASVTWGEPLEIMAGEEPAAFARRLESAVRAL